MLPPRGRPFYRSLHACLFCPSPKPSPGCHKTIVVHVGKFNYVKGSPNLSSISCLCATRVPGYPANPIASASWPESRQWYSPLAIGFKLFDLLAQRCLAPALLYCRSSQLQLMLWRMPAKIKCINCDSMLKQSCIQMRIESGLCAGSIMAKAWKARRVTWIYENCRVEQCWRYTITMF